MGLVGCGAGWVWDVGLLGYDVGKRCWVAGKWQNYSPQTTVTVL